MYWANFKPKRIALVHRAVTWRKHGFLVLNFKQFVIHMQSHSYNQASAPKCHWNYWSTKQLFVKATVSYDMPRKKRISTVLLSYKNYIEILSYLLETFKGFVRFIFAQCLGAIVLIF